jgi:hypothetical protein
MPWKESSVMKERRRFVARLLDRLSRVQRPRIQCLGAMPRSTNADGLYTMSRMVFVMPVLVVLPLVTGCASSGGSSEGQTGLSVIGDEKGGSIPGSVGVAGTQSSAYQMVTAHCAKFGKKGFITKMDFESGLMTFQCIVQKPKGST